MKLEHVALTISNPDEIKNFYRDLLDLMLEKTFHLSKKLAAGTLIILGSLKFLKALVKSYLKDKLYEKQNKNRHNNLR